MSYAVVDDCFSKKKSDYKVKVVIVSQCCHVVLNKFLSQFVNLVWNQNSDKQAGQNNKMNFRNERLKKKKKINKLQDVRRKRMQMLGACCHGDVQTLKNTAAPHWGDITAAATQTDRQSVAVWRNDQVADMNGETSVSADELLNVSSEHSSIFTPTIRFDYFLWRN